VRLVLTLLGAVGWEARACQTWSIAGLLGAHEVLRNPRRIEIFAHADAEATACSVPLAESRSLPRSN
jgi:hypothetical protein